MEPTLREGDRLWVKYGTQPSIGSMVIARFPDGTVAVKRAAERRGEKWWLLSDNPAEGVDSRHRGAISPDQILAVVKFRLPSLARLYARIKSSEVRE